jgi:hypothetical protein
MGYYADITAGLGAMVSAGFLTLEGAVLASPAVLNLGAGNPFTTLTYVLYAAGFTFIGAGVYERFFSSAMKPKSDAEEVAPAK